MEKMMNRKKRASESAAGAERPEPRARNVGVGGGSSRNRDDHRPLVKNHFKSKVWHKAPYDRCTMPPFCENGNTICVYLRWGLTCKFYAEGNCQARSGATREKDPEIIKAMREEDDT